MGVLGPCPDSPQNLAPHPQSIPGMCTPPPCPAEGREMSHSRFCLFLERSLHPMTVQSMEDQRLGPLPYLGHSSFRAFCGMDCCLLRMHPSSASASTQSRFLYSPLGVTLPPPSRPPYIQTAPPESLFPGHLTYEKTP